MAETSSSRIVDAMKPDGFVDYYQLIDAAPDATTTRLRGQINDLYTEAQANRDHRNLNKRREYQLLLELLPQARTILLDDDSRARYDAYADENRRGTVTLSFEDLVHELTSKDAHVSPEKSNILGLRENSREPGREEAAEAKAAARRAMPRQQLSNSAETSLRGSAMSVITFALVVAIMLFLKADMSLAILVGSGVALVVWVLTHFVFNKTSVR